MPEALNPQLNEPNYLFMLPLAGLLAASIGAYILFSDEHKIITLPVGNKPPGAELQPDPAVDISSAVVVDRPGAPQEERQESLGTYLLGHERQTMLHDTVQTNARTFYDFAEANNFDARFFHFEPDDPDTITTRGILQYGAFGIEQGATHGVGVLRTEEGYDTSAGFDLITYTVGNDTYYISTDQPTISEAGRWDAMLSETGQAWTLDGISIADLEGATAWVTAAIDGEFNRFAEAA